MTRSVSQKPAKTRRFMITFIGPKGGYHHLPYTFKLNQKILFEHSIHSERGKDIVRRMKQDGWILRFVEWHKGSVQRIPSAILLYRVHQNDVYNARGVKPGWRIVGES